MSLRYTILGVLSYKELSGYDFKAEFEGSVGFFWTAKLSQVYKELGLLEAEGLVTSRIEPQSSKPDRKVYKATEAGKKDFEKWMRNFPDSFNYSPKDEFILRMYFAYMLPPNELEFELQRFIRRKQQLLEVYDNQYKEIEESPCLDDYQKFIRHMCLQKGVTSAKSSVEWAEDFIRNLQKRQSSK
ncbi:MAG: putative transcriptional regulator [Clostridia bacterium]|nr:putative transcriptional regulator [Clostridia bacterium]